MMKTENLVMWKMFPGIFAFQTNSPKLAGQMKKRKWHLVASGISEYQAVFITELNDFQAAKKRFKGLTGQDPNYDGENDIYFLKTPDTY